MVGGRHLGGQATVGSTSVEFHRTDTPALVEDFLQGPPKDMDAHGILSIHYDGQTQRIPVSPNIGKKISLGDKVRRSRSWNTFPTPNPSPVPRCISSRTAASRISDAGTARASSRQEEPVTRSLLRRRPS